MLLAEPALASKDTATKAKDTATKEKAAPEAKHCPKEITDKQIEEFMTHKKATINNVEFHVRPKFDKFAGKSYTEHLKHDKKLATISLKSEKVRGDKAVCIYTYTYMKKKEGSDKETERKGRIRTYTMLQGPVAEAEKKQ